MGETRERKIFANGEWRGGVASLLVGMAVATLAWWALIAWAVWSLLLAPAAALTTVALAADLVVALSAAKVSGRCSRFEEAMTMKTEGRGERLERRGDKR